MNACTTKGQARIQWSDYSDVYRVDWVALGASFVARERQRGQLAEAELGWLLKQHGIRSNSIASLVSLLGQKITAALVRAGGRQQGGHLAGVPRGAVSRQTSPAEAVRHGETHARRRFRRFHHSALKKHEKADPSVRLVHSQAKRRLDMHDSATEARAKFPALETNRRRLLGGVVGGTLAGVFRWHATEANKQRRHPHHGKRRNRRQDQDDTRRAKGERKAGGTSTGDGASTRAGSPPALKVLTRNLYLGADLGRLNEAETFEELVGAVTQVFAMMQATDFPERAATLADEIASIDPHLVGLQEAIRWRSGTIETDFVDILLSELAARGKTYAVAATVDNLDAEAPYVTGAGLRLLHVTDRDVLLARTDLPEHVFSITNSQSGNFDDQVITELPGPDPTTPILVPIPAGWTAVDVNLHGETIRVVSTHLEPFALDIQAGQRAELLNGPLQTTVPTVLMGDLNSPAPGGATYQTMLDAGFADGWTAGGGHDPGFTAVQDENLRNPTSALSVRIDYVLTRGNITATSANRVGHRIEDRTASGLWPSDHAGVWAVVQLKDD